MNMNILIMTLYISALGHARKLKFSSYVHLPSINKITLLRLNDSVQCRRGYYFQAWALEHSRNIKLGIYYILSCSSDIQINKLQTMLCSSDLEVCKKRFNNHSGG